MQFPDHVDIVEVGLRDGLQSEAVIVPTEKKLAIIDQLIEAGVKYIQVASFVHPKYVPQMADAEDICAGLKAYDGVIYSGLVLNKRGVERAVKAGLTHVDMGISASDTHSKKNANRTVDEALEEFADMVALARENNLTVRGGIQVAFGCVYEGHIRQEKVERITQRYLELGVDELALADSTGMANPIQMRAMMDSITVMAGETPIVLHLHDTRGLGLANMIAAMEAGISKFDTSFGGMGGCPFIKGATGNIATEDCLNLLESMGIHTGIDRSKISAISADLASIIGHEHAGKLYKLDTREAV